MKRQIPKDDKPAEVQVSRRAFLKDAGLIVGGAAITTALAPATAALAESVAGTSPTTPAPAQAEVKLEVLDPSGAFEVTALHAKRLDTLEGKTICELSDNEWQSWRTFPLIRELLQKKYPTLKIITWDTFPRDGDHGYPDFAAHPDLLKGCDAAIVGNAG